jgi:hypothetical protein
MNNINTLTTGTINGLNSLSLDTLTTTNLNSDFIDGDLIYYNKIEGNEIIVDTKLTLTNTGVISVGSSTISDIELTYLDGVNSNIQTQINNINTNNSGLSATVNQHTAQISALEASDSTQNTTLTTHTSQISAIQSVNATQTTDINNLNFAVAGQSAVISSLGTDVSNLQTKTQNITADSNATTMTKPLIINYSGESLKMNGNTVNIGAYGTDGIDKNWFLGNEIIGRLSLTNYDNESIYIRSGAKASNDPALGWKPLNIHSLGLNLYRGGTEIGNTQTYIGQIGPNQTNLNDSVFYITGNGANNINILASSGNVNVNGLTITLNAGNVNALVISNSQITTNVPKPADDDVSSKIATTSWVQTRLLTLPYFVKRAYVRRVQTNSNFLNNNSFKITVNDGGQANWGATEFFTLRISFQQQFNFYSTPPQTTFNEANKSTTCDLNVYPRRFTINWLNDGDGPGGGPSGIVSTNQIYGTNSLFNISVVPGKTDYGRQFWANNLNFTTVGVGSNNESGANSFLFICGQDSNPDTFGFSVVNSNFPFSPRGNYDFNLSVELLNFPSNAGYTMITSNFDVNFSHSS